MATVEKMGFGWIVINGRKHRHDVVIFPDGTVKRRGGGILMFGNHLFTLREFEELCGHELDALVVGTGTDGVAEVSEDARNLIESRRVTLFECPSEEAIRKLDELVKDGKTVGAIVHVTC